MTCTPTTARIRVDLPPPLGPRRPTTCPRGTERLRSGSTSRPPRTTRRWSTTTASSLALFVMWGNIATDPGKAARPRTLAHAPLACPDVLPQRAAPALPSGRLPGRERRGQCLAAPRRHRARDHLPLRRLLRVPRHRRRRRLPARARGWPARIPRRRGRPDAADVHPRRTPRGLLRDLGCRGPRRTDVRRRAGRVHAPARHLLGLRTPDERGPPCPSRPTSTRSRPRPAGRRSSWSTKPTPRASAPTRHRATSSPGSPTTTGSVAATPWRWCTWSRTGPESATSTSAAPAATATSPTCSASTASPTATSPPPDPADEPSGRRRQVQPGERQRLGEVELALG